MSFRLLTLAPRFGRHFFGQCSRNQASFTTYVNVLRPLGLFGELIRCPEPIASRSLSSSRLCLEPSTISSAGAKQRVSLQEWDQSLSMPPYVDPRLSYAYGRSFKNFKYGTVGAAIKEKSISEPDSTSAVFYEEGISKSFKQLNEDVNKLLNGMVKTLKLNRGDSVGVYSYNCYQYIVVQFACNKLGLKFHPINPSYKYHEFSYILSKAHLKALFLPGKNSRQSSLNDHHAVICHESIGQLQKEGKLNELSDLILLDGDLEEKELCLANVSVRRWRAVFDGSSQLDDSTQKMVEKVSPDDIYGIYYTSGTTGFPKGAAVVQCNVMNNAALSCERLFNQRGPKFNSIRPNVCLPLPLFHEFAGVLGVLMPFTIGGSFVFPGMRYNIKTVVDSILRFRCNSIFVTPTILIDLLGHIEANEIKNFPLRLILIAGSSVMSELVYRAHRIMPELEEIRIGYGSSENGVIATLQTSQELEETRAYTVGGPLDYTEVRIADPNTDETLALGQSGEVQTRGFNTMEGYHNEPEKTSEVINKARWYKTGDLGILDRHGSLQIVGRIKDIILKGGENIYPAEVETVLHTHQAIEDAHVFGVPDKRFGEEVCVWVKLKASSEAHRTEQQIKSDIVDFCKRRLTYFKVPKYVIFVKEFPVTPVKKIKKFEMRAKTIQMLNLD